MTCVSSRVLFARGPGPSGDGFEDLLVGQPLRDRRLCLRELLWQRRVDQVVLYAQVERPDLFFCVRTPE